MEEGHIHGYRFRPMRWRDAFTVATWRYPGEYAFYDMGWGELILIRISNPLMRALGVASFYAVDDRNGKLVGVFSYIKRGEDDVEIGVAMRPNLTGQGNGLAYVRAGMEFGRLRYAPKRFTLTVAAFNRRAQTVYERAGFVAQRTFSRESHGRLMEHIEMACDAAAQREQG